MNTAPQIIEWAFSSPFIWMMLLGVVVAHSLRKHALYSAMPYAPLIEEKSYNNLGVRMLLSFALGISAALFIYFTQATLSFSYCLGIWFIAFIFMAKAKEPIAFLGAALILCIVSLFADGAQSVYKIVRFAGLYQLILGILYLVGRKETFPVMQQGKEGDIRGEHMYKEVWPLPALVFSMTGMAQPLSSFLIIVMLLFCEIRINRTTPKKYFRRNGTYMAASGLVLSAASFMGQGGLQTAALFVLIFAAMLYWIVSEIRFNKNNGYLFCADDTGVQVLFVYDETPACEMGLKIGDLIVSINSRRVVSPEAVELFLEDRPPFIWLEVRRGDKTFEAEYKDYQDGVGELGIVPTPKNPTKYELYPRPGYFANLFSSFRSLFIRRK